MKKILTLALAVLLALSLLTACGGGGNSGGNTPGGNTPDGTQNNESGGAATPASDNSGGSKSTSSAAKEPLTVELNKVIVDADNLKVMLTSYEYNDIYGNTFHFTIENNTDEEINLSVRRISVNGCMLEDVLDVFSRKMKTEPGKTNTEANISLSAEAMEMRGITAIRDFEFTSNLSGTDDSLIVGGSVNLIGEPIAIQLPADSGFTQTFDSKGVVVLDKEGIKVTAIRVDYDISSNTNHGIWMFVENNSGYDVDVVGILDEVNDITKTLDAKIFCTVMNGKVAFGYLNIYKPTFEEYGGKGNIETVQLSFYADVLKSKENSNPPRLIGNSGDKTVATVSFDANVKAH